MEELEKTDVVECYQPGNEKVWFTSYPQNKYVFDFSKGSNGDHA